MLKQKDCNKKGKKPTMPPLPLPPPPNLPPTCPLPPPAPLPTFKHTTVYSSIQQCYFRAIKQAYANSALFQAYCTTGATKNFCILEREHYWCMLL